MASTGATVLIATVVLLLLGQNVSAAVKATKQALIKPIIVLIGDSITENGNEVPHGWALQLASAYTRRADIMNRGFGGGLLVAAIGLYQQRQQQQQ